MVVFLTYLQSALPSLPFLLFCFFLFRCSLFILYRPSGYCKLVNQNCAELIQCFIRTLPVPALASGILSMYFLLLLLALYPLSYFVYVIWIVCYFFFQGCEGRALGGEGEGVYVSCFDFTNFLSFIQTLREQQVVAVSIVLLSIKDHDILMLISGDRSKTCNT